MTHTKTIPYVSKAERRPRLAVVFFAVLFAVWPSVKEVPAITYTYASQSDIIGDRLRHSTNPILRRSVYRGRSCHQGFPVLLDSNQLPEHLHVIGPPGSGKTSLGLETAIRQLIPMNDGALVIIDGKGDIGLFNSVRHMAHLHGREFKWFTPRPFRSTYVFNPWDQRLQQRLTLGDIVALFTQSLNLHHGQDYGRAWFSVNIRNLLRQAILETVPNVGKRIVSNRGRQRSLFPAHGPIQSFRDLHKILQHLTKDDEEFKAAKHLVYIVDCLCDLQQLNMAPNTDPNHPALEHAIFMPEVVEKKQIVYFYLPGALDDASVSEIAKLVIYSLFSAVTEYYERTGTRPRVYSFWDEAQIMVAQNIEYVLTHSRSYGLACILAHQAMSQLNPPGGVDLRELVMQCTLIKQVFGVRDPWLMEYISRTSGTTKYFRRGYDVSSADALAGCIDPVYTCPDREGQMRVHIQEYTGPRLSYEDIMQASRQMNVSLMSTGRPTPMCPFKGWFPVHTDWPVPHSLRQQYESLGWPKKTEATIETGGLWPDDDGPVPAIPGPSDSSPSGTTAAGTIDEVWQDIQDTENP